MVIVVIKKHSLSSHSALYEIGLTIPFFCKYMHVNNCVGMIINFF